MTYLLIARICAALTQGKKPPLPMMVGVMTKCRCGYVG